MAGTLTAVDFSQLPQPQVVAQLAYEDIVSAMLADLQARVEADGDTFTALLESDPAYKIIEVCAYRELLLRQSANEDALAVMLAYAEGGDLDQIGANYDCPRLTITPANPNAIPPTAAVMEQDPPYKARIQQSMEGFSVAGPVGAYVFFAKSASGDVLDASATSPVGGTVLVSILSQSNNGNAPSSTIEAVEAVLTAATTRPLTDTVIVQSAQVQNYSVNAVIELAPTADEETVIANATAAAQAYATSVFLLGYTVALAKMAGAIGVAGVSNVAMQAPGMTADIVNTPQQSAFCTGITITVGSIGV
jgi:phage-related baseplate assembly protein